MNSNINNLHTILNKTIDASTTTKEGQRSKVGTTTTIFTRCCYTLRDRIITCGSLDHSSISSNESVATAQSVSIARSPSPSALASVSMSSISQQHSITPSAPQSAMQQSEPAGAEQAPAAECNANETSGRNNGLLNLFHDQDTCKFKNHHLDS